MWQCIPFDPGDVDVRSEIPQRPLDAASSVFAQNHGLEGRTYKGGYSGLLAALHHLLVSHPVGRDKHHLRPPRIVRLLDELHDIRASSSLLRVPEGHALRLDTALDETGDGGAERLLLVRTYPDQVPVRTKKRETICVS